jgi:hypothetical protein
MKRHPALIAAAVPAKRAEKRRTPDTKVGGSYETLLVEPRGLEPLTFWLPARRSPS